MRFKRFTAGIVAAVMAVTAVATPLGDNLPAVRESASLTAGAAVSASKWGTAITNKNDSRVSSALNNITSQQKNISSTVQSGKSVKDMIYYLVFESEYAVYGGKTIPNNHCNANADGGTWTNTFAEETVYGYKIEMATTRRGCFWYAGYISNIIYGKDGAGDSNSANIICRNGGLTSSSLKSFITKYLQAGEHIRMESSSNSPHSISYISYDANGFYYLDYLGYKNENAGLRYITYDKFVSVVNSYNYKVYVYNANVTDNNTSTPTPSQFITDHYKLTSPDGYQTIRKEASTSSANLGSINTGNIVCVTKYSSDNKWGYLTYNGVSGWIRLYYVEKTGSAHSYGSWYTKTSPTCTSGGTEERKCSCGATERRSTSALGHSYGSWYTSVNPGCTTAGTEKRVCSRCNSAETRSTSALGHNYSSQWTIDKPATCSAEGSKSRHCTRCDAKTEVTAIAKNAHTYTSKVVKPTLTQQGYTLHTCSVCGYSYKDNYTAVRENPSKVTGLAFGARSADYVSLKWNKDANADGYIVEYLSGNKFVKLADKTSGSSVSHKVTGLEAGTLYKFRVRSYANVGGKRVYGKYSDVLNVRTLPKAMSNLKLGARTDNSISLKWDKNETANGAVVEMYKNGQWVVVATKTSNTAVSHKITGLDASTAYKFRVRAYINDEGGRIYSVYNTTLNEATAPAAVKNFRRTISAKTAIRFNWDKNTTADGYSFEMIKNSKWTTVATIEDGTATNYSQLKLNPGTAYRFRIRAYKVVNGKKIFSGYSYVNASTAK